MTPVVAWLRRLSGRLQDAPSPDGKPGAVAEQASPQNRCLTVARPPQESLPEVEQGILAALADGSASGRAVARNLGLRWGVVFTALKALLDAGKVVREGAGRSSLYRLALTEPPPQDGPLSCPRCGREFYERANLNAHLLDHEVQP